MFVKYLAGLAACLLLFSPFLANSAPNNDAAKNNERIAARGLACEVNNQYRDAFDCFGNYTVRNGEAKSALAQKVSERLMYHDILELYQADDWLTQAAASQKDEEIAELDNKAAELFIERGWYNKAAALLNESLAKRPGSIAAIDNRGKLFLLLGKYEDAIKDFAEAFNKAKEAINDPDTINLTSFHLGLASFAAGKYDDVPLNFEAIRSLNVHDARTVPLLYFVDKNKGGDGRDVLNNVQLTVDDGPWLRAIIGVMKDIAPVEQPIKSIEESLSKQPDSASKNYTASLRQCEVYCYLGYYFLANGKKDLAKENFLKAAGTKARRKSEFALALAGLRKLDAFKEDMTARDAEGDYPAVDYKPVKQPLAYAPFVPKNALRDNPAAAAQDGDWAVYACRGRGTGYQTVEFNGTRDGQLFARVMLKEDNLENYPLGMPTTLLQAAKVPADFRPEPFISPRVRQYFAAILQPADPRVVKIGTEKLKLEKREVECVIYQMEDLNGNVLKNWYCEQAPFGGLMKIESRGKTVMEVIAFGGKKDAVPGGNVTFETAYYSADAFLAAVSTDQEKALQKTLADFRKMKIEDVYKTFVNFQTKKTVSFEDMMKDCEATRVVYVGEKHNSTECHNMQLQVIKHMAEKNPELVIGFEMFFRTEAIQKGLDDFIEGKITEDEFKEKYYEPCWSVDWYKYYRDIFLFARTKKIKLVGLNCPKDLMKAFKEKPDVLSPDQRKGFAKEVDYKDPRHHKITMWNFRGMIDAGMPQAVVEARYPGQCIWDDTMGESVANYLVAHPKAQMVVCVGSMHSSYRLTMPGRAVKKAKAAGVDLTYRSLLPHDCTETPDAALEELMRLDIADYIFFTPPAAE